MKLDSKTENAVLRTLDRYAERYGAKDADDVTDLFADDPDVLLIALGTPQTPHAAPGCRRRLGDPSQHLRLSTL